MRFYSGYDLAYLASDLYLGAKKLLGFLYFLAGNDLAYLELHSGKILIGNFRLCFDINAFFLLFFLCLGSHHGLCQFFFLLCYFLHIQTGKQNFRLCRYLVAALIQTELLKVAEISYGSIQLLHNLFSGFGHIGLQKGCADGNAFH